MRLGSQIESSVRSFYASWGKEDADGMVAFVADDCIYHDTVFQDPFVGKADIREYFAEILKYYDPEVSFVVDDLSIDLTGKVGVQWSPSAPLPAGDRAHFRHAEVSGYTIPFSRGCSFLRVNQDMKIEYARDCVEPAIKSGHNAMKVMTVVVPLVKRLGPNADPALLKKLPIASALLCAFYGWYLWLAFFSLDAPGVPGLMTSAASFEKILHESVNFFYIYPLLDSLGVPTLIPSIPEHPVDEALFNLVGAWGLMYLPIMLTDSRSQKMAPPLRWGLWTGTWFLTNLFFIPYNALRLAPSMEPESDERQPLPSWSPMVAAFSGVMGVISIGWALYGRPEYGDLTQRLPYTLNAFQSDRIFWLFLWDIGLYSIFQIVLLNKRAGSGSAIPFFGLVFYLFNTIQKLPEENEITVDSK